MSAILATTSQLLVHAQNTAAPHTQADAPNGLPAQTNPDADQTQRGPDADVDISSQATEASKSEGEHTTTGGDTQTKDQDKDQPESKESKTPEAQSTTGRELNEDEKKQLDELKQRDQEVRRHEQAHKAAAGQHAQGGPTYSYQKGPDGRQYAVGGEVQIDTSPVPDDPQATIQKMQAVRQAALAPAEPSSQDRSVAAQASRAEQQARRELSELRSEEARQLGQGTEAVSSEQTEGESSQEADSTSSKAPSDTGETPSFDVTSAISAASAASQTTFIPQSGRLLDALA